MRRSMRLPIAVSGRRFSELGPVPQSYLRAVLATGGEPVVLMPSERAAVASAAALGSCAGLLLTGGGNIAPAMYGQQPTADGGRADPLRDAFEVGLVTEAMHRGLPVLAVCRGMQLLNVALGGSLRQQLAPSLAARHGSAEAWARHPVRLLPGSRLAAAVAAAEIGDCSSHHQQVIAELGAGLVAAGWSSDGMVEAVEQDGAAWVVGVQWHPEDTAHVNPAQRRIFEAFIGMSRAHGESA